ncbi:MULTISPECIES: hypothetical protein [unclassified Bosea (in: a-proteobacteria)]|uniref:hypothetical protein n=1 Tax=unclassified Bosea (in: a-proteobacteria) TaxID=2653178 RepID=UPI000F75A986|nr:MULTISPECIES: hypothetical protein [unclassified Bosea (in: a-proteobacteria)]AZO81844.1 hypothetical protein BLM15_28925 [Bosea sp. Tri-49]RXT24932.1 hypothetical protein B5U98_08155 [Bosea sp. Tri-39]RXT33484.1 hypothetical protein B5U99_18580 [Bosea sp. Tri-54]
MITGNGYLYLRNGRRAEVSYEFAGNYDDQRAGHLLFDTTTFDDSLFYYRLILTCEDGEAVAVSIMNRGDRHLAVTGRVLARTQPA